MWHTVGELTWLLPRAQHGAAINMYGRGRSTAATSLSATTPAHAQDRDVRFNERGGFWVLDIVTARGDAASARVMSEGDGTHDGFGSCRV